MKKGLKMDKCREEFEAYMLKNGYEKQALSKSNHYDCYHYTIIDAMYSVWKASRESMKAIKLPNAIKADNRLLGDNEYCSGYNQALRYCEKQITSAGYKVE